MSATVEQAGLIPVPIPDEPSLPFFRAAQRGTLMLQRCSQCSAYMWPVKTRCVECFAPDPGWAPSSGRGSLYTFAIVHRAMQPGFADSVPYNLAVVELDEGVRMRTTIADAVPEQLEIGMRVEVIFERLTGEVSLPKFRRVRHGAEGVLPDIREDYV